MMGRKSFETITVAKGRWKTGEGNLLYIPLQQVGQTVVHLGKSRQNDRSFLVRQPELLIQVKQVITQVLGIVYGKAVAEQKLL